ncbi:PCMD domain-containing protein [uncultured Bacteroides sp.]|uniref:PCMD domain-containing protein n=1 Tax=uncultured Bacteroides sp. TaxID=162156 RepID=UPI0025F1AEA4|nr:PCMD domain-containing protein [uncultured Bacteroides sp.]
MKKNLFYLFALICSMSLFTACSDDDDPVYPIEEELAGTYKGTLDIELDGTSVANGMPKNITIAKAGNNIISLELKDFSFMEMNLGTIKLEKCVLKQNGTSYTFTGSQELNLSGIGKCNVDVVGTINNGKAEANLNIDVLQLGQKVKVVYKGTKLTGAESSEAKITAFTIDSELVTEQPVIDEATGIITFKVRDTATDNDLKALKPIFTISEKATVTPASGVAQDFSGGKTVVYTVISENGTVKAYKVSIAGSQSELKFSFEEWETVPGSFLTNEYYSPLPTDLLATSAPGAAYLKLFKVTDLPVFQTDDKKAGESAIKLVTMDTSDKVNALVPAITSGSVFTGKFVLNTGDRIASSKFGIAYDKRPVYFRGWYKYAPGAKYIDGSKATKPEEVIEKTDIVDECAIQAVLYEAVDADGEEVILTGHDINTSDYRVAVARLEDGTAKAEYTYFDIPFTFLTGKAYETSKTYKLAIVCSSSKDGDSFMGAGGSTLILDELEVIGESVAAE